MENLPPSRAREIPNWISRLLPEQVQRTGVLTVEDTATINFGAIVPFVIVVSLLFLIPPMIAFIVDANLITLGFITFLSTVAAFFWIKGVLFQRVIEIPIGWVGSLRLMGESVNIAMATGSHMLWIPEKFFGVQILRVDLVPIIDISREIKFENIETYGNKSGTVVYVSGKTSKIWDIYDPIAASRYVLPQKDLSEKKAVDETISKLEQVLEDWYQSRIPEALGEVDGRNLSKKASSGRTLLNDVFWSKILEVRNGGITVLKYTGESFVHSGNLLTGEPFSITIEKGTPLAFVGSDLDKWVMHTPEELDYLRTNFNRFGEHILFPAWGIRLKSAWFHDPNPTDPEVQKDLQSGAKVEAKTKAYQNALSDLIKKANRSQPVDASGAKIPLSEAQLINLREIAKLLSGISSETRTFETKSYPEITKLAETLGPDIVTAISAYFKKP